MTIYIRVPKRSNIFSLGWCGERGGSTNLTPLLTIDSPGRVLLCDWDPTGRTLFVSLEPHVQTRGTEHVMIGTDDGLLHLVIITQKIF